MRSTSTTSPFLTQPVASPSETTQGCYWPWSPSQVYTSGDLVTVSGLNYQSDCWTQNVNPPMAPQYGEWNAVGNCVVSLSCTTSTTLVGSKAITTASVFLTTTTTTTTATSITTTSIATTSIVQTAVTGASCSLTNSSQCVGGTLYYCHRFIWEIWYKGIANNCR
ncbi:hypothetical protein BC830DRAFT_313944 [Chytriomyces sp. MP71]|nr:hypothetical protein BC830DRAFT_313944 [Chytriomyces sp. MP71]